MYADAQTHWQCWRYFFSSFFSSFLCLKPLVQTADVLEVTSGRLVLSQQNDATHYPLLPADINVMDAAAVKPIQASRRVRRLVEMVNSVFDAPQNTPKLPRTPQS